MSTMLVSEEWRRIEENLSVIRQYLKCKFPDCVITEESFPSRYYIFTVMHGTSLHTYKLKVDWSRLSRRRNIPENTLFELHSNYVASWMVRSGYGYYSW